MITATATLAARTTEVTVLQVKKGRLEGKENKQILKDAAESIYDNGEKIIGITQYTKIGGVATTHYLNVQVASIFNESQSLSETLQSTGGKFVPYVFVAYAWIKTIQSTISEDPVDHAEQRGYVLK